VHGKVGQGHRGLLQHCDARLQHCTLMGSPQVCQELLSCVPFVLIEGICGKLDFVVVKVNLQNVIQELFHRHSVLSQACMCMCVWACACVHVCLCACVHVCVCICACVCMCVCACVSMCVCMCVYVRVYAQNIGQTK
jgi:hypothetical protein